MYASRFVTVDPATKEQRRMSASTSSPPNCQKELMIMKLNTPTAPTIQPSACTTTSAAGRVRESAIFTATPTPDHRNRVGNGGVLMISQAILEHSTATEISQALIGLLDDYPDFCFCISTQSAWLRFLPARLPHSPLLENAIAATLHAFHYIACDDERAKIDAWRRYTAVIKHLRKVLSCGEDMKGEVVATIVSVSQFKLFLCS